MQINDLFLKRDNMKVFSQYTHLMLKGWLTQIEKKTRKVSCTSSVYLAMQIVFGLIFQGFDIPSLRFLPSILIQLPLC